MNTFPMNNSVEFLWNLVPLFLRRGDIAVDATLGNGKDMAALYRIVGPQGHVYGFDIQEEALNQTRTLLGGDAASVTLIHGSHCTMKAHVKEPVDLVLFNLGYLPGGDKSITTVAETTLEAMVAGLELLKSGGKLAAVLYTGHEAGAREAELVKAWSSTLDQRQFSAATLAFTNQVNHPPQLLLIEKRG